jgi:hypothetical protein
MGINDWDTLCRNFRTLISSLHYYITITIMLVLFRYNNIFNRYLCYLQIHYLLALSTGCNS